MQMTISVDNGKVTLGTDTIDAPHCSDGLMFGFGLVEVYYVISLRDKFARP